MVSETCETCRYVRTFAPRQDERDRYGFEDIGYGCRYPGYEGYTQPDSSCPTHQPKEPSQ